MKSRVIVYVILITMVALLGLFGLKIGAGKLVWLAGAGIVFLFFQLAKGSREEA